MSNRCRRNQPSAVVVIVWGATLAGGCVGSTALTGGGSGQVAEVADSVEPDDQVGEASSGAPSPRGGAPGVWLPEARRMVLFGGMSPITNDTFEFNSDEATWVELHPERSGAVPDPRCHHTFVSIPGQEAGLLFGGFSFAGRFNDTWRYDGTTQTWNQVDTVGVPPARRCLHAATIIESTNQMLVYGGIAGAGTRESEFFDDTHTLDLADNRWTRLDADGPGKLEGPVLFYSSALDEAYLWGGKQVDHYPTGLWRFDVSAQEWSAIPTDGDGPLGREDPTWFWDDARGVLTVHSGRNDDTAAVLLDDIWQLELPAATWSQLEVDTKPGNRWRATVVFDPAADRGLMFGGWRDFGGFDSFDDTWSYEPATGTWAALE